MKIKQLLAVSSFICIVTTTALLAENKKGSPSRAADPEVIAFKNKQNGTWQEFLKNQGLQRRAAKDHALTLPPTERGPYLEKFNHEQAKERQEFKSKLALERKDLIAAHHQAHQEANEKRKKEMREKRTGRLEKKAAFQEEQSQMHGKKAQILKERAQKMPGTPVGRASKKDEIQYDGLRKGDNPKKK